jgi:hypothetical protein
MGGLFAGVEATLADKAGDDAGFDRRDMAAAITLPNQVSGQAVQRMKGRGAARKPGMNPRHWFSTLTPPGPANNRLSASSICGVSIRAMNDALTLRWMKQPFRSIPQGECG